MELFFPFLALLGACLASGYYTFKLIRRKVSLPIAVTCAVIAVSISVAASNFGAWNFVEGGIAKVISSMFYAMRKLC